MRVRPHYRSRHRDGVRLVSAALGAAKWAYMLYERILEPYDIFPTSLVKPLTP